MKNSSKRLSALTEIVLGAVAVIGHNVYHVLPNEVPLLVLILWVSLLVRRTPWRSVGLRKPASWKVTLVVSVCGGALLQLKDFAIEPLAHLIWNQKENVSSVLTDVHPQNLITALSSLAVVWTFAAFGEELGYRALLLRRTSDAMNGSRFAYAAAVVFSSILFGFGHYYKGPTGIFDSTMSGLILAAAYLLTGRNLWAPILAHGLSDTIAVVATFFGW